MINCLKSAKISNCTLVLDREFFSRENINLAEGEGYSLIIGVQKEIKPSTGWKIVKLKSTYI